MSTTSQSIKFRQRILVDVSKRDLSTTILGEPAALPLILAPVGLTGMQHGDGEIHACRAAQAAGIPYTLSTMSICSIEDVAASVDKPFWFQLYVMKDRGFIKALIERAIAAKCSALVLTVDLQVIGQRHADIKNGMTVPPEWSLSKLVDFATKPAWVAGVLRGKRRTFGNLVGHLKGTDDITALGTWIATQFDTSLKIDAPSADKGDMVEGRCHARGRGGHIDVKDLSRPAVNILHDQRLSLKITNPETPSERCRRFSNVSPVPSATTRPV